jgi:ribosomal protein S11
MKKITFLFTFLVFAFSYGQGLETFDNATDLPSGGSYADGAFEGEDGFTWNYVHARDEGDFGIDGPGIMLRRASDPSSLSATITGGIGDFSLDTRKAFTGNAQRILELYINETLIETFEPAFGDGADETVIPFIVEDINIEGEFTLELRVGGTGTTNRQITLDNLAWTAYSSGGSDDGCLDAPFGQWPSAAYTPATCDGTEFVITSAAYTGEYSVVNIVDGFTYIFSSSVDTDYVTISDATGNEVLAFGTSSAELDADFDGQIRFYIHLSDNCDSSTAIRSRLVSCEETTGGGGDDGCLDAPFGQWPSAAYTPATCDGTEFVITSAAYTGEYSVVNIVDGFTYIFSSSVDTDYVTISDATGNEVLAFGTSSAELDADFDGQIRFYIHLSDNCDSSTAIRSRLVSCEETTGGGGDDGCLDAPFGQWPSAAYTPATCDGTEFVITSAAYTGEYSVVNIVDGFTYIFSSSVDTDYVTISDATGNEVLAFGTSSAELDADFDGQIRFYIHLSDNCDSSTAIRSRLVSCEETNGGGGDDGCLDAPNGQFPSAAYTPATCDGTTENTITSLAWTGEYSVVNVVDGFTYTFSSSIDTDFVTISDVDGTMVLASGVTSADWESDFDGQVRFYLHLSDECDSINSGLRSRIVVCEEGAGGGGDDGCLDAPNGQFPSAAYTPATCDGTTENTITSLAWTGEYSIVNVVDGFTYTFSSSIDTDFVTISDVDGAVVLASGVTSAAWESDFDGQVRFYLHLSDECDSINSGLRSRIVVCEEGAGGGGDDGCLDAPYGQWPSAAYTPASCNGTTVNTITTAAWTGEYSVVNVVDGFTYTFSSSIDTDFVTIGDVDGTIVLASGLTSVEWESDFDGQVRFYLHLSDECDSINTGLRSKFVVCEDPDGGVVTGPECGGIFTDSGGVNGNYDNNEDITWTIEPDEDGDFVTVIFTSFDVEANWDALYVYDGPDTDSPIISSGNPATLSGFPAGGYYGTTIPGPFESSHSTGALTFRFLSDGSVTRPGWVADVVCSPAPPPNDLIENAISVTNEDQPYTDSSVRLQFATNELLNPDGCNIAGTNGVWYSFTAAFEGSAEASITSPSGTSAVIFYEAPSENVADETELTFIFDMDNQCAPSTSSSIPTIAGQSYYIFVLNTGGASDVVIDISDSLGTIDNTIDGFVFYPNPASSVVNVQADTSIDNIEFYNVLGQRVIDQNINAMSSQIDINGLASGVYLMRVTSGELTATYRVIKK